jgi:hypothetical protein
MRHRRIRSTFRKRTRPTLKPTGPVIAVVGGVDRKLNEVSHMKVRHNRGSGPGTKRAIAREVARAAAGPRRNG